MQIKDEAFGTFADWLEKTPSAAPAWRLFWQVSEELTLNTEDSAKPGDIRDLTHLSTAPYVDALTLDGRFLNYTRQATAKLKGISSSVDYGDRLFRSFGEIVNTTRDCDGLTGEALGPAELIAVRRRRAALGFAWRITL